jgi:O-antigen ligase
MAQVRCRGGRNKFKVQSFRLKVKTEHGTRNSLFNLITVAVCAVALFGSAVLAFTTIRAMQTQTRGVMYGTPAQTSFGINVALEQYSDADLARALQMIRDTGFRYVRQHFYWNEIEPRQNEFAWSKWDRIVDQAGLRGLAIIAVIDTTPVWARHPGEADLVYAPPANVDDYARFIAAFVAHYGNRVSYIQIWDNPNVHPFWGRRNADPLEYAALLRAAATAARTANPNVKIISAGLAPSKELIRGHPDYSDVLFLRGLYQASARDYFDIVGVKAYGMWTGPDDRRVDKDVFNFSRAILLRDDMLAYGDGTKPVWAVEFGWNALPENWSGKPSPWGTDTEATQSQRLIDAIQRARREWAWMPVMIAQTFQPNAPSDDPQWGFAFIDKNFQPRVFYSALRDAVAAPVLPALFDFSRFYLTIAALSIVALVVLAIGARAAWQLPWEKIWLALESRFAALPEFAQFVLLVLVVIAFYYSPNSILNFALLALIVFLFALRLDIGLAIVVFTIPFYLLPKNLIGSSQFSLVELLTLAAVAARIIKQVSSFKVQGLTLKPETWTLKLLSLDGAVLVFVLLGIVSVATAANFGVAMREFRVIVIEPVLLYALIRTANLSARGVRRLIDTFILSAVAISLIALYQFFFTNWVIVGEGVRRVLAVYGSPNNLALYLGRALPLAIAMLVFGGGRLEVAARNLPAPVQPMRVGWAELLPQWFDNAHHKIYSLVSAIIIAAAWFLTYSRGAWLGIIAGLACIAFFSDRRIRLAMLVLLFIGAMLAIPFLQTERAQSLFQIGTGTGFFRMSVWQSASAMIRDHPVFGIGLDNFLYEYPKYINPAAWREPNLSHPHNVVLDFWVRLGIGGVIVLAWMVWEFYRAGLRNIATQRGLAIGLLASMSVALAHGLIDAAYFYVDLAFVWMLILAEISKLEIGN